MTDTPIVKIALPGKSSDSTEPRDFAFNSKYSTVRIYSEDSGEKTVSASSSGTVTIGHGLSFVPMCMIFVELASGHWYNGVCIPSQADGFPDSYVSVSPNSTLTYVDTTNLVIRLNNATLAEKTIKYKYYIFADDGI